MSFPRIQHDPSSSVQSVPDEIPLSRGELTHWQVYLPQNLWQQLQDAPLAPPRDLLLSCLTHLTTLLEATTSHLPGSLVKQVKRNPIPGQADGQFVDGTLLFADISGFTAMSERLSRTGREGAEEVTAVVNRYFEVMLDILRQHDGQLIRFGGDALLGLFEERPFFPTSNITDFDPPPFSESATRAVQAAMIMQEAMSQFAHTETSQGTFPLRMSVGVHKGRFFTAQLGHRENMEFALFGKDVNLAAAAESIANAGQVVLDQDTFDAINPEIWCHATPVADEPTYFMVQSIGQPNNRPTPTFMDTHYPLPPTLPVLRRTIRLLDVFTPFLPAGLLPRLNSDPNAPSLKGEPRLVASLFVNIDGLGEIADRLGTGNEDVIVTAVNHYFIRMSQALERYGGVINKIDLYDHGDKLLVTFGAPVAHEDDPERAVRAALAMQEALSEINETLPEQVGLPDIFLRQRIGISYGSVYAGYVGASWRHEYTVMGDKVNLAARLMSAAESNQIVVCENVWRKANAMAELSLRGNVNLKGKSKPVPIYEVVELKPVQEQTRGLQGMQSPLVGRDTELKQLQIIFDELAAGQGHVAVINGEAGSGKTRLVKDVIPDDQRSFGVRCMSYTESVSYRPFQDLVRQLVNLTVEEDDEVALPLLKASLGKWLPLDEANAHLPYIANFLNVPLRSDLQEKIRYLDGEALQQRTFVGLQRLLQAQAQAAPLVLLLDDIQWMDHASLDLLDYLLPLVETVPIVWLLLFRPMPNQGCRPICDQAAQSLAEKYTELKLPELSRRQSRQLLFNLVEADAWPGGAADLVLNRAEGNPLYLEEVLRSLINDGLLVQTKHDSWQFSDQVTTITLPDTLEGVLLARLDRLEELCRWTVQVASVVGRSFPVDVLANVLDGEGKRPFSTHLTQLQQVEIIREMQRHPELVYVFMHTLMQEVSYSSLSAGSRREYHRLIAAYLENGRSAGWGNVESLPPLIAHHAFAGQDWPRAMKYQMLAGEQAQQLFANYEAVDHFERALHSAAQLTNTFDERLSIHLALSQLFISTGQYDEANGHLVQAMSLAESQHNLVAKTAVCRWQVRLHELKGEYDKAFTWIEKGMANQSQAETADYAQILLLAGLINIRQGNYDDAINQCLTVLNIAEKLGEVTVLARAYNLLGITYLRSDSTTAIDNFGKAFELYAQAGDLQGQATSHNLIANACFNLGRWQEADHHYRQAQRMFAQIGDVYNQAIADNNLGGIARNRGQLDDAFHFYEEGLRLAKQIGGSAWMVGVFHMNLGATYARQGDVTAAKAHLQSSQYHFEQAQSRDFLSEMTRHWAEVALRAGDISEAKLLAKDALTLAQEMTMPGEIGCALCVLGRIAMSQQRFFEARRLLTESVEKLADVADEYELARARYWLARLLVDTGNPHEAGTLLDAAMAVFKRLEAVMDETAVSKLQVKINN
jgi:class 3 adenylate cyclase/tetratricopeptide (TPR) repeat protein